MTKNSENQNCIVFHDSKGDIKWKMFFQKWKAFFEWDENICSDLLIKITLWKWYPEFQLTINNKESWKEIKISKIHGTYSCDWKWDDSFNKFIDKLLHKLNNFENILD